MKKKQKQNTTPPCFVPNNISFYSLCPSVRKYAFVCACACAYQEMSEGRKCYANVSHKHLSNSSHMHLCCVQDHPFNVHILHTSMRVCRSPLCAVKLRCAGTVCWQCDCGIWCFERHMFTRGATQQKKRKTNQVNMGGLSVPDWRSVSQQWDFLSYCLLVYSYRLMSPLLPLSWVENTRAAMEISEDAVKHLWSCSFTLSFVLNAC